MKDLVNQILRLCPANSEELDNWDQSDMYYNLLDIKNLAEQLKMKLK